MEKIILKDYEENPIHVYIYKPETKIKAVVHMIHGASEHFARYGLFAEFLNKHGYLVIGCDNLGHGLSAKTLEYVHFADKNGDILAYESILLVKEYIEENYKEYDAYLLGHSMGSFLGRKLVLDFPNFYKKAVFSGTGTKPQAIINVVSFMIKVMKLFKGPKYISKFIQDQAIMSIPIQMKKDGIIEEVNNDWICRDKEIVKYYDNSNMCGQPFTIQANYDMAKWVTFLNKKKNYELGNKEMPIFFISGTHDGVSEYGKQIKQIYETMEKAGYQNLSMKLYPEARHEVLNELNKDEVYQDVLDFFNK